MRKAKLQTKKLLEKGGMLQEGGTVDPVSGNEVPVGSMQEEVRDDIPAKLSEGEFVFPADVVRYIGLERLMQMRQAAKEGLKKMEAMGQMSNAEEATEDDDGEFESKLDEIFEEIEGEEEETETEMAVGGMAMDQQQQPQQPQQIQQLQQPAIPEGMSQEDVTKTSPIPQQQPEQPDAMAENMMPPSSIIQQDMAREGYSTEKKTEFEDLMVRIATNKAMAMQRNNTVFVLTPSNTEGTVRLHTFTADQPNVLQDSIGQLIGKLKEAKVQKVESQTRDQEMISALESGGYKPNVSEEGGMYTYTMDIQEEPAVQ